MMLWARLTWQAADPAAHAADLARRLDVVAVPGGVVDGAWVIALGGADLEIRPWQPESPSDRPQPGGRLVFEPFGAPLPNPGSEPAPMTLAAVGWSTVELDRAEGELGSWFAAADDGAAPPGGTPADGVEPHLGARVRVRRTQGLPGELVVLAEPSTEGPLAASLARDGEGPCALYLRPAAGLDGWMGAWLRLTRGRRTRALRVLDGPLGPSVLVPGGSPAGPFVIVVDRPADASPTPPASTIGP